MRVVKGFVVAVMLSGTVIAQEAAVADRMDELDNALWDQVRIAADFANAQCHALPSVQSFNAIREKNLKRIESRHPGYTMNELGTALVVKK